MSQKAPTIYGLHYLRAIATVLVVLTHNVLAASQEKYFGPGLLTPFFKGGGGEVDFFFVMSGYIMIVTATDASTGAPRYAASEFLWRRAIRLLPMLYIAVAFYNVALLSSGASPDYWSTIRALVVWPTGSVAPAVAWTIRYEVLFYLVFAACFLFMPKIWWLSFVWACLPLISYFLTGRDVDTGDIASFLVSPFHLEFGLGMLMALLLRKWRPCWIISGQIIILVALSLAIRALVIYCDLQIRTLAMVLSIAPLVVLAMLVAVCTKNVRESRIGLLLGDASYSIFLFHQPCMPACLLLLSRAVPWLPTTAAVAVSSMVGICVGILAHLLLEKRIQTYFENRKKGQAQPALA